MSRRSVVGFDARELWLDVDSQWTDEKRLQYLLRRDAVKPLSVDSCVWYSVFSADRFWKDVKLREEYRTAAWQATFAGEWRLDRPDVFMPRRVWTNLEALMNHLAEGWGDDWKPCAIIAAEDMTDEVEYPVEPAEVDPNWQLLGYDVADYELYSGLMDGGLTPELLGRIKPDWIDKLNAHHLFTDEETAREYIDFANVRMSSHQPFDVYALYLIQMIRGGL